MAHGRMVLLKCYAMSSTLEIYVCRRYGVPNEYLRERALEANIDFLIDKDVNSVAFIDRLSNYNADLFVSMSFDQILRQQLYSLPKLGTINCHAGKLHFYRGEMY